MNETEQLAAWLIHRSDKVKRNVTVVSPAEVGQDYLLHISTDTGIKEFVPYIGWRQGNKEDRSVPRICTAPTLLGCLMGVGDPENYPLYTAPHESDDAGALYRGGFKIYALDFQAALKPTGQLVYDQRLTGEHWLVAYSQATAAYKPRTAGKFFYRTLTFRTRLDKMPEIDVEIFAEVTQPQGIRFSKRFFLKQGYWRIAGPAQQHVASWETDTRFVVEEITRSEYLSNKNACADMLSMEDNSQAAPDMLYHGSRFRQPELMPGIKHSKELVEWDNGESNLWLYATTEKEEAIGLGIAGAIEHTFDDFAAYNVVGDRIEVVTANRLLTMKQLEELKVYLYTIAYHDDDGWEKNANKQNGLDKTEYKTTGIIKDIMSCVEVDVKAWLANKQVSFTLAHNKVSMENRPAWTSW